MQEPQPSQGPLAPAAQQAPPPPPSGPPTLGQRLKQLFAPIAVGLAAAGKFILPALKFGWPLLKMGGFMFLSLWFYARFYGWPFAVGFIVLIFVHEMGHLIAARIVGLKVGLPVFIPFLGAAIALKEAPPNAWIEAIVGIGGPLLGSLGSLLVASVYFLTGNPLYIVLGYTGCFLNLFNLIPMIPFDGGRIVSAVSPWLWFVGLAILVPYMLMHAHGISFLILIIAFTSIPRLLALFRRRRDPQQMRYFECTPSQRWTMALLYFSLMASLYLAMGTLKKFMDTGSF